MLDMGGSHYLVKVPNEGVNKLTVKQVVVLNEVCEYATEEQAAVIKNIIDKFWTYRV